MFLLDPGDVEDKFLSQSIMQGIMQVPVQGVDHMHIKSVTTDLVTNSLALIKPCP